MRRPSVYLVTNAVSAALWAGGIGTGAYLVGPSVIDFVDDLGTVLAIVVLVVVAVLVAAELRRRWLKGRSATT